MTICIWCKIELMDDETWCPDCEQPNCQWLCSKCDTVCDMEQWPICWWCKTDNIKAMWADDEEE